MEVQWHNAHYDILTEIFTYLPRRDRLACYFVCNRWRDALQNPALWRTMVVHLDTDLTEPSTVNLTKMYHKHIKVLELGWANPQQPTRWIPHKFQELTKRSVRYILVLTNTPIELHSIKIVAWFEMYRFKKVLYHLCRFLRTQFHLRRISLYNANLRGSDCLKLLMSCLNSRNTIINLNIVNCYYHFQSLTHVRFRDFIENLQNLVILKLDYVVLCNGVFETLCSNNVKLEIIDICVKQNDFLSGDISEDSWKCLRRRCTKLKVAFNFYNVCCFEDIRLFLKKSIPLTSFSLHCGKCLNQVHSRYFRRTLQLLLKNYWPILEHVCLHLRNNRENLDDLIVKVVTTCPNLRKLHFDGVVQNVYIFKRILNLQNKSYGFNYLTLYPKTLNEDMHSVLSQLHFDYSDDIKKEKITIDMSRERLRNEIYLYY